MSQPSSSAGCCGCTTVRALIQRASRVLNDDQRGDVNDPCTATGGDYPDMVRWSYPVLIDFLNEGLSYLSALRPDAFTVNEVLTLKPGRTQELPEGYDTLVSILYNAESGADGKITEGAPVNEESDTYSRKLDNDCQPGRAAGRNGNAATDAREVVVTGYAVSQHDRKSFTVSPPVPRSGAAKVLARVVREPCALSTNDLDACVGVPRKFEVPLLDWILHRSYLIETESQFSSRASADALQRFYRAIGAGYLQDSRFNGDNFLGMAEDKYDPNGVAKARGV